ncbi:MAG: tagatose-bisphosphate aldolase, partial [Anaerolineaceae bacterium]|nr:tagatose-bisphosphate aldolase [Anaerolineaceae bacterium]
MSNQKTELASLMTTSELRAFQRICSDSGKMLVVAMDQRNSMRAAMRSNGDQADEITNDDLGDVKCRLVDGLGNFAPALLLDPECALPKAVDAGVLSRDTALIVSLDASGYDRGENSGLRESRVVNGVNARRVRDLGGDAGKLLVFMRPDKDDGDSFAQSLIKKTVEEFEKENVLLVVEILVYRLENETEEEYL